MDDLRCPKMDLLGLRMIEAYRRVSDTEDFAESIPERLRAHEAMIAVQAQMESHRDECSLCRAIRWKQEVVRAFANSEPAWRGTMAS
jgi:hypothetical protein